ncbi:complex I subunit 4 family protein [Adhaeretor mobilis]|uniref:NAD(P)H-quinone oxidoreductase chain 4 1 n=1 Tax=Adhaeretor mobilis TaxID=1930276 RepID=A0A517MV03_9BACT|nr:NADH-quinone oxidoreductase subunit M [Adhaeretor mobilis]QDS98713.1 NAD(P)H-quinone oxidoreductase chain 4 1 [Adhaeretor mobilis]
MSLSEPKVYLSFLVFLPAVAALVLAFFPRGKEEVLKFATLGVTMFTFILSLGLFRQGAGIDFEMGVAEMQNLFALDWIPSFGIQYMMGIDGISFPLVVLTTFLCVLAMGASWPINKHVKAYCILFLLLETGILGCFVSLDFFLFYVFWEVMLLPMYFLIGVWGGPRREYAAIKFFLYTLFGSVLMLIAILMLYFNSDLTELNATQLANTGIISFAEEGDAQSAMDEWLAGDSDLAKEYAAVNSANESNADESTRRQLHTFNILALQQIGQNTSQFQGTALFGQTVGWWAFLMLFVGFVIKVPGVPFHTWLPDAHVEAPTPISMILAGILLKLGGYGILRICYPICPHAGYDLAYFVCLLGVVSMVWGAFAALAQKDFKRMVAYSSVSHMGYVVLGFAVWSAFGSNGYNPEYWEMGVNGAMFQMIAHGISSAGMFFMVGVVYDRVHHRNLEEFGGLFAKMPVYSGLAVGIFFAGLGLPGLCGFIGEVLVVLSVWKYSYVLAIISASVVILTAGYILWAIQRVYLGAEYKGPHPEALVPITMRELAIASPLLALAIVLGVYPRVLLDYMQPSVDRQVERLAELTEGFEEQEKARQELEGTEEVAIARAQPRLPDGIFGSDVLPNTTLKFSSTEPAQ